MSGKKLWLEDKKISIPVRLHDSREIREKINAKYHELHLSFSEVLSEDLLNENNFLKISNIVFTCQIISIAIESWIHFQSINLPDPKV